MKEKNFPIIFCDLHAEPSWVYRQVAFISAACEWAEIPFITLDSDLYGDFIQNFGHRRVSSIPFWTVGPDGKKGKMPRQCTYDYKIKVIEQFVRYRLLGYRYRQKAKSWDIHAHEMHMGIMTDERHRVKPSRQTLFTNRYPLVKMGWTRAECFAYNKKVWDLDTWASSCVFCPFHSCYFFAYMRQNELESYDKILRIDNLLKRNQACPPLESSLYLTKQHRRFCEHLLVDAPQTFFYGGRSIWNGF